MKKNTKIIVGSITAAVALIALLVGVFVVKPQMDTQARIERWGINKDVGVALDKKLTNISQKIESFNSTVKKASQDSNVYTQKSALDMGGEQKKRFDSIIQEFDNIQEDLASTYDATGVPQAVKDNINELQRTLYMVKGNHKYNGVELKQIALTVSNISGFYAINQIKDDYLPGGDKLNSDQMVTIAKKIAESADESWQQL